MHHLAVVIGKDHGKFVPWTPGPFPLREDSPIWDEKSLELLHQHDAVEVFLFVDYAHLADWYSDLVYKPRRVIEAWHQATKWIETVGK